MSEIIRLGIISDTHGLVRPEALAALRGCDLIVHAGDVGRPEVLDELAALSPVRAVRGNVDRGDWAEALPRDDVIEVGDRLLYVLHDRDELELDPAAAGFHALISGHSHEPCIETRDGVLFLNPGSAGPRRFRLPIACARLEISGAELRPEIVTLVP